MCVVPSDNNKAHLCIHITELLWLYTTQSPPDLIRTEKLREWLAKPMDILFINGLPFIVALLLAIPPLREALPKLAQTIITSGSMALLFVSLVGFFPYVDGDQVVQRTVEWMPELGVNLTYYLDGLALLFALVISGIGSIIFFYAGYYFEDKDEQARFNTNLMVFAGAMLGLVTSSNIITLFIMWELTSITSFLLISFKGYKEEKARYGGLQALIITGGGGLALFAGLLLLGLISGEQLGLGGITFEMSEILTAEGVTDHPWYEATALLIFLGCFTKSAQFPFHFWLPGGMSAPTPASAFLHSATMVKAGIYLLLRLYPVMANVDLWTNLVTGVGLVTMTMGAIISVTQRDLKGLLAYSTVSKLGAIVALIGLPDEIGLKAALVSILAHAFYKAALFLTVGTVDHAIGTRVIDKLGGLYKKMPLTTGVAVISGLSMAGLPFFFGFVAKEVLIAGTMDIETDWFLVATGMVAVASAFTAAAAAILMWDVYFRKPDHDVHIHHEMPKEIDYGPGVLAAGSLTFGFLLDPLIIPLLDSALKKEFELYLFPGFITEFFISLGAIAAGLVIFATRGVWLKLPDFPISGAWVYDRTLDSINWIGDQTLRIQSGRVRYYLAAILGSLAAFILGSGLLVDLTVGEDLGQRMIDSINTTDTFLLEVMLLILIIGSAFGSVISRRHLIATLALGVMGYGVAGIFLVRQAPDVALVQFLVETLATVMVIILISRTSAVQRRKVMERLFRAGDGSTSRLGIYRDVAIASVIGFLVFVFAATALANRPDRASIAQYHLDNAEPEIGVTDVVSGILTDFRGMDTLIEIIVVAMAALGILSLLSLNRSQERGKQDARATAELARAEIIFMSTPLTRMLASFILPFAIYMAITQALYGSYAPGDGFTGGVTAGLGVAAWFIVFGYNIARERLDFLANSYRILSIGFMVTLINASWPILIGDAFMSYHKLDGVELAGLSLSTTLVFEIGIALTIFGAVGLMLETIAHPSEVALRNRGAATDLYNEPGVEPEHATDAAPADANGNLKETVEEDAEAEKQ
jgi:NADH:ubiquinone oxidoreductase subunit 5 (subunit L)/multisubunit Na+/H+ antiporter MnhA subunit/multisubunit Na+/H+ antiporter MnhB subunit